MRAIEREARAFVIERCDAERAGRVARAAVRSLELAAVRIDFRVTAGAALCAEAFVLEARRLPVPHAMTVLTGSLTETAFVGIRFLVAGPARVRRRESETRLCRVRPMTRHTGRH